MRIPTIAHLKSLYAKYERFLLPGALAIGIVADFITFRAINTETAFILLLVHTFLAGTAIILLNLYKNHQLETPSKFSKYVLLITPLVLQFSFGAMLSASLVFYWFSGAFAVSWPVFALLLLLMISNDVFRDYYQLPKVQISIYYFALFSFSSVAFPYLLNSIESWSFVLAGMISLIAITAYIFFAAQILPELKHLQRFFGFSIGSIYIAMNLLYFFNLIPPIPLSITDMGVYERVQLQGDNYQVTRNKQSFIQKLLPGTLIKMESTDAIYLYSAIFAPTDLSTTIVHDWEFFDENENRWRKSSDISFALTGGRSDGYRGYTYKRNHQEGKWRVTVRTQRGQALGRLVFKVEYADGSDLDLVTETK